MKTRKVSLLLILISLFFRIGTAQAQQTIFNVPSPRVIDKNEVYFQPEVNFRPWHPDPSIEFNNNFAYGLGRNIELDITQFNLEPPKAENLSIGVGLRGIIPILKKKYAERELKLTLGEMIPVSLTGRGVGNWTYGHFSGKLSRTDTLLVAGVSAGTSQIFGRDTVHFIGALEQPIPHSEKLKLAVDWLSGTHDFAFLTPGLEYEVNKSLTFQFGYQIPNNKQVGRSGFILQLETRF